MYLILRDIDKVDELMADITEQQEVAQQISDAISRPVGFGDDVDEVIGRGGQGMLKARDQSEGMPKRIVGQVWGELQKYGFGNRIFLCSEWSFPPTSRMSCWRS